LKLISIGSLESARAKCKLAQYLSDLSATEDIHITKSKENRESKRIASPPMLKTTGSYSYF